MGLDMSVRSIKADLIGDQQIDIDVQKALGCPPEPESGPDVLVEHYRKCREITDKAIKDGVYNNKLWYWRKFYALDDWMRDLYRKRGGVGDFNCSAMRLHPEDLDKIEADFPTANEESSVFCDFDDGEEPKLFTAKAREAIANGHAVLYYAWF